MQESSCSLRNLAYYKCISVISVISDMRKSTGQGNFLINTWRPDGLMELCI